MEDIIITGFDNVSKEGLTIHLNKKAQLKGSKMNRHDTFWLSWDAIGKRLFEGYTDKIEVDERNKLRNNG